MKANLSINTIIQLSNEVGKSKQIKEKNKIKYKSKLDDLKNDFEKIEIMEKFKLQYNQLNLKGTELIKDLKNSKKKSQSEIERSVHLYIRYLKASLGDFKGNTVNLRKYITSFLFSAILFLALSPQFYGFILPVLFFLPIYIGLKGVKQRSINGFYMTMSLVPVSLMTSFTWIRYGINTVGDYQNAVSVIVQSGVDQNLAKILVIGGPIGGAILFIFTCLQLYRGLKTRDLFI